MAETPVNDGEICLVKCGKGQSVLLRLRLRATHRYPSCTFTFVAAERPPSHLCELPLLHPPIARLPRSRLYRYCQITVPDINIMNTW